MTASKAGAPSKNVENSDNTFDYQIQVRIAKFIRYLHVVNFMTLFSLLSKVSAKWIPDADFKTIFDHTNR